MFYRFLFAIWLGAVVLCVGLWAAVAAQAADKPEVAVERNLVYASPGGEDLRLDAYLPPGEGPFPAVLVVHGGAWRLGSKGQLSAYAYALAENDIAAFCINYRLAPEHRFPAQIEDCRSALQWIADNADKYHVDVDRLGGVGYSAGGHLVALLGAEDPQAAASDAAGDKPSDANSGGGAPADAEGAQRDPPRLCVVAAGGAPCDFQYFPERWDSLAYWLGGSRRELPAVYREASPIYHVSADDPPMYFYHGESDLLVPRQSPQAMVEALKAAGVEAELYLAPGSGHIATTADAEALRRGFEFLAKHLKAQPTE